MRKRANLRLVGGMHYNQYGDLQPWDVVEYFGLGFLDGNAVKYLLRWQHKGTGKLDLTKAIHYIEKLLEQLESTQPTKRKKRGNNRPGKRVSPKVQSPRGVGNRNSGSRFEGPTMPNTTRRSR